METYLSKNVTCKNALKFNGYRYDRQPEASGKVKACVFATTALGVGAGTALCFKRHNYSINPSKIFKNFKNSGFMKVPFYDWKNILTISTSSILGGLTGGVLFDKKENRNAKIREGTIQFLANIVVPLTFVAGGINMFCKYLKGPILKLLKQTDFKGSPKMHGTVGKWMDVFATAGFLFTGLTFGNRATNLLNEKLYNIRDNRKVKPADFSAHLDDLCLGISVGLGDKNPFTAAISKIIPATLIVCGYSTGVKQEWPPHIKQTKRANPNKPIKF